MKKYFGLLLLLATLQACRTSKKVQTIQTAITKKDTTQTVVIKPENKIDSVAVVKDIITKVSQHRIDFNTFYGKIKIDYESQTESRGFTAYLYMKKDSVMYLRLVGSFLGITKEGVAAKITKDSVVVLNKIDKIVQYRSIAYLQEVTQIPFDFNTLQDLLIGNAVYLDSNVVNYRNNDEKLSVLMIGKVFKHLISLDKSDYKVLHSKLDDIDINRNRTCDISYSNFQPLANGDVFAVNRKVSVAEKAKLDVWLEFKQYTFNEPLTYMFNIPKNYKKQ